MQRKQSDYFDHLLDCMQVLGPVTARRMFGGHGMFIDGLMFALVAEDTLYLKIDAKTRPAFEKEGLESFTFDRGGRLIEMSYMQAPPEILEDMEQMREWGNLAIEAALRSRKD